jgi:hypothetical protein
MDDLYDMAKDTAFRKKKAEEYGLGFELPGSVSLVVQLYRMYRKSSPKLAQQKPPELMNWREKDWSGREDLNLRPPGPEPVLRTQRKKDGWKRFGINSLHLSASAKLKPPASAAPHLLEIAGTPLNSPSTSLIETLFDAVQGTAKFKGQLTLI